MHSACTFLAHLVVIQQMESSEQLFDFLKKFFTAEIIAVMLPADLYWIFSVNFY